MEILLGKCPECKGYGSRSQHSPVADSNYYVGLPNVICERCRGTGSATPDAPRSTLEEQHSDMVATAARYQAIRD